MDWKHKAYLEDSEFYDFFLFFDRILIERFAKLEIPEPRALKSSYDTNICVRKMQWS